MTRIAVALTVVVAALVSIAAQPPVDESTLLDSEKRIPPGHYCKRADVTITARETHAHPCSCTMSCTVDEQGAVTTHESSSCMAYCEKNGRRCTCHVEEPCPKDGHNALMDMRGRVVAMARRR
jgi:hypothetical protein